MTIYNGGPAYPTEENRKASEIGLTVFDHFFGTILSGMITGLVQGGAQLGKSEMDTIVQLAHDMTCRAMGKRGSLYDA